MSHEDVCLRHNLYTYLHEMESELSFQMSIIGTAPQLMLPEVLRLTIHSITGHDSSCKCSGTYQEDSRQGVALGCGTE